MPARTKERVISNINKLGIIAGGGHLPRQLQEHCQSNNIKTLIVGFEDHTDKVKPDYWGRIGAAQKIIDFFKSKDVEHLVFIGSIKRPNFLNLWPDWTTFKFFLKAWLNSYGDDSLLKSARNELENRGFKFHGIHELLPALLMPKGVIGKTKPKDNHKKDIEVGIEAARQHGVADLGQAVLIKNGTIIAKEHRAGTNAMIRRHGEEGAILVKMCKPQQDIDLDLPTIGPETIEACAAHKFAGIVGQADYMLAIDQDEMAKQADKNNMFIVGMNLDA